MAKILLATTDTGLQDVFSAETEGEGHELLIVMDGQEAFEAGLDGEADLVFLDVNLPVFNGLEICSMLREDPTVPRELPIYLLTNDDQNAYSLEKAGVTGTFSKTHEAWQLRELLADWLRDAP